MNVVEIGAPNSSRPQSFQRRCRSVWRDEIYQDRKEEESEKETDVFYGAF